MRALPPPGQAALAFGGGLVPLAALALAAPWIPLGPTASGALGFGAAALALLFPALNGPVAWATRGPVALALALAGCGAAALSFALPPVASGLVGSLAVLVVACVVGWSVGRRIESPGHLPAAALVSAAMDLWSVTSPVGPTHRIVQNPVLLRLLTVSAAVPPWRDPLPMIGFGDVVFAALYSAACARHGLPPRRTALGLAAGLALAGLGAWLLAVPVPALPALGIAIVLAQPATWRIAPRDRGATALAAGLLVFAAVRAAIR